MNLLPLELIRRRQWLCWRYVNVGNCNKPRKVPFYANGEKRRGANGCAEDVAQLVTFEEALAAAEKIGATGVGLALLQGCGITALDFDNCIIDGVVHPEVLALVADSYAEVSPSLKGVRAFFAGDLGNRKDFAGDFGFEVFSSSGFVTVTGNTLPVCAVLGTATDVAPVSSALLAFCAARFGRAVPSVKTPPVDAEPVLGLEDGQIEQMLAVLDPAMPYSEWIGVGMAIHHETGGAGFELWNGWSALAANYPNVSVLQRHWDSFGRCSGKAQVTARLLLKRSAAAGLRVLPLPDCAGDFEAVCEAGSEANPEEVYEGATPRPERFTVMDGGDFARGEPAPWLIKGVLPQADLGVVYGESGSGKSFFVSDMALALARGQSWRGCRSRQCRVVYVVAEGGGGFRKRLRAYELHHEIMLADVPFGVIHAAPNFLLKGDVLDVVQAIKEWGGADLVVVDTFAQVMPGGNENAGEHVGRALAHCKALNKALGAMVLLVHHCGKDASKGARGWSGLRAAVDVEIEVSRSLFGRCARLTKQKDGEDSGQWGFELMTVHVGMDEDGDVVDSCVVIEATLPQNEMEAAAASGRQRGGRWEYLIREVMGEFTLAQSAGIEVEAVLSNCLARLPPPLGRDTRRQCLRRALASLCEGAGALYRLEDDGSLAVVS